VEVRPFASCLLSDNTSGEGSDMSFLSAEKSWVVLPMYPICGLALGLINPLFGDWVVHLGAVKPGVATAISVNMLMPALALALAVAYPRLWTAIVGAVAMSAGFVLGMTVMHPPGQPLDVFGVLGSIRPVLVLACAGYAILGVVAVLVTRTVKKAGGWSSSSVTDGE
jgi:hypothetical protein